MTLYLFANDAATTLAGPIASNATTMNVAAGTGSLFPAPTAGQAFAVTLTKAGDLTGLTLNEIVYVTARSGDTFTITRAQEGTSAKAWSAGDNVQNFWTAGNATAMVQEAELQLQPGNYAAATGSANAQTVAITPVPASLALITGAPIRFKAVATNTGTTTLTVTGAGTATIINPDGTNLGAGQIVIGAVYEVVYNGSAFVLIGNPYALLSRNNTWSGTNGFQAITATTVTTTGNIVSAATISGNVLTASGNISSSSGQVSGVTLASSNGNITAGNGRLRATFGAYGSGDGNAAAILADFLSGRNGNNSYIYERFPDGTIIQAETRITVTGADVFNYPTPFGAACAQVFAIEGLPAGWFGNPPQPTIFGTQDLNAVGFSLYCVKWNPSTGQFALGTNVTFRYLAIGY